ncbi:MAG TPA: ankyrin repeat domain-containing protein [Bryobacteraceae bacterium]|nr:ankyrin repeat domain-containing protein [Bryobacteraceae bacterium]
MKYVAPLLCMAAILASAGDINDRFYDVIRAGDTAGMRELLRSGADVDGKDPRGATPLFYAASVGTPEAMRILIAAGADVNARTTFGATPLMWSTADLTKVRLLVEKGAEVNAQSKAGNTVLLIASAQAGNLEILRYLFDHGAAIEQARNEIGETPLLRAAATGDLGMVKLLIEKGDDPKAVDAGGRTPLLRASAHGAVEIAQLLLSKGADVNAQSTPQFGQPVKHGFVEIGRLTPLMVAVVSGSPATVKLLLDAGGDVNASDVRGMTPLMLSVASDHANPDIVRMILAKKPELSLTSKSGETALRWAQKFQDRAVLSQIHTVSSASAAPRIAQTAAVTSGPRDVRQAAEKGLALVQKTTASFFREGGCVSCHAQHVTGVAVAVARSKGIPVDEAAANDVLQQTRLEFASRADQFLERIDGPADTILTNAVAALGAQGVPANRMIDAMVRNVASQQSPDGSWKLIGIVRPPTADGSFTLTASTIRVLRQYAAPALRDEMDRRIARATDWLIHAIATTTEDATMQLLGAKWGGADSASLQRFTQNLIRLQRDGGGWGQLPQLHPDAYATGKALYALQEGGGLPTSTPACQRGVRFLLDSEAADGSWRVTTRAPRIQPYFESGFPYGEDQWISHWGTAWATAALALATPERIAVH